MLASRLDCPASVMKTFPRGFSKYRMFVCFFPFFSFFGVNLAPKGEAVGDDIPGETRTSSRFMNSTSFGHGSRDQTRRNYGPRL